MVSERIRVLNKGLRAHDSMLYARREDNGMVNVYRKGIRWDALEFQGNTLQYVREQPVFVLALTHNWSLTGQPVEWGIEPVISKIKESDFQRTGVLACDELAKEREKAKELRDRANRNDIAARAYDLRGEFAKATNDINTSSMEKADKRRKYDGY